MLAFCLGLLRFGLGRNEVPALCPRKDLWTACKAKLVIMVPLVDMPCRSHGKGVCVCVHVFVRVCMQGFSCLSRGAVRPGPHFGQFAKQCHIITSFMSVTAQ